MATEPPAGLALVMEFENTLDLESGIDELGTPAALAGWLAGRALVDAGLVLDEGELVRVREFREAVRALLLANNGEPADPAATATLNRVAASARLRVGFGADGRAELRPAADGVDRALAALLAAITGAVADGSWPRLKACHNRDCRWAFYDRSKNRSGTWCTMAECGNRAKARAYRARDRRARSPIPD